MPFQSKAQRRKFYEMMKEGLISKETVAQWEKETPKNKPLPERVKWSKSPKIKVIKVK